jgi:hypothetical protein
VVSGYLLADSATWTELCWLWQAAALATSWEVTAGSAEAPTLESAVTDRTAARGREGARTGSPRGGSGRPAHTHARPDDASPCHRAVWRVHALTRALAGAARTSGTASPMRPLTNGARHEGARWTAKGKNGA